MAFEANVSQNHVLRLLRYELESAAGWKSGMTFSFILASSLPGLLLLFLSLALWLLLLLHRYSLLFAFPQGGRLSELHRTGVHPPCLMRASSAGFLEVMGLLRSPLYSKDRNLNRKHFTMSPDLAPDKLEVVLTVVWMPEISADVWSIGRNRSALKLGEFV